MSRDPGQGLGNVPGPPRAVPTLYLALRRYIRGGLVPASLRFHSGWPWACRGPTETGIRRRGSGRWATIDRRPIRRGSGRPEQHSNGNHDV